jgi:hypothetical protein
MRLVKWPACWILVLAGLTGIDHFASPLHESGLEPEAGLAGARQAPSVRRSIYSLAKEPSRPILPAPRIVQSVVTHPDQEAPTGVLRGSLVSLHILLAV